MLHADLFSVGSQWRHASVVKLVLSQAKSLSAVRAGREVVRGQKKKAKARTRQRAAAGAFGLAVTLVCIPA